MALFPVHARERDAFGLLKPHSEAGPMVEGGKVVCVGFEGVNPVINIIDDDGYANDKLHGLLDEQLDGPETLLGKFLPASKTPVVLGPATYLGSNRISVWFADGWFLTDNYDIETDGYGEASTLNPGDYLLAKANDGQLATAGKGGTEVTKIRFMKMVDDVSDLMASYVSPAPKTGMFAKKPAILIYQE